MQVLTEIMDTDTVKFCPQGHWDLYNSQKFMPLIRKVRVEGFVNFIVDLGQVDYIDSSGIGVLLNLMSTASHRQENLLLTGLTRTTAKVFYMTRIENLFNIFDTVEKAYSVVKTLKKNAVPKIIQIDGNHRLFDKSALIFKEWKIGLPQVRRLSGLICCQAPAEIREENMLEQQVSELVKNAVKHGNRCDPDKSVGIWYGFSSHHAHLIIQDEGEGFGGIEEWNKFYAKKMELYRNGDYEKMMDYLSFRTEKSRDEDGGNAMMAAVEYWNQGLVFNPARNAVAVKRLF